MAAPGQNLLMLGVLVVNPVTLVVSAATCADAAPPGPRIVAADRAPAAATTQDAAQPTMGIQISDGVG